MDRPFTPHQKRYFAEQLTLARPAREAEALACSMSGVRVDLNPHQVEAALFALKSPLSNGSLLADEVGLGKTIEAGLVLAQLWAERKQNILLILPAALRVQWKSELESKFNIPCVIIERPRAQKEAVPANPFWRAANDRKVAICSYEFAANCKEELRAVPWDLVIIDEAHRLRNVYKKGSNARAKSIQEALRGRKKLLLTATPLQNNLRELYGLSMIIDEHLFGDAAVFASTDLTILRARLKNFCVRTLRREVAETGHIKFTKRQVLTRPYTPSNQEQELYTLVSEYLQRSHVHALPDKGRQLVAMVIRKLLASSSAAISKTLQSLINRLELPCGEQEGVIENTLAEDFETFGEYSEEYESEEDEPDTVCPAKQQAMMQELELLRNIKTLADSIPEDAKGTELLAALEAGFSRVDDNKGARKAVVFTESTRTQMYLLDLLQTHGYEGQIVLLNGSNSDDISKRIYAEWKERHKDDGTITASSTKAANIKAAIVEEFRDSASILIGTEAAAEGINLQFCSMVVNYDLPWNPQRVEQRIGRCHRYGQRYDVVVINFLNLKNAADKRVYDLLEKKFRLFEGVFGSSDEVLGALERGIDFERSAYDIVQRCRTDEEIERAFDELTRKYAGLINEQRSAAERKVFENFGEDVIAALRLREHTTRAQLNQFSRWKMALFLAFGANRVDEKSWAFVYEGKHYVPSWETAKAGGIFLDSTVQMYPELLGKARRFSVPPAAIRFLCSSLPATEQAQSAFFRDHLGLTGAVSIDKLTYTYDAETAAEEHLLVNWVTDGDDLDDSLFESLMELPAEIMAAGAAKLDDRLQAKAAAWQAEKCDEIDNANKENLLLRFKELDAWCNDCVDALELELNDLRNEIQLKQGQMEANIGALSFRDVISMQGEINKLENEIDRKQRKKLQSKDEIRETTKRLQAQAIRQLDGTARLENIMTFSFEIV